MSSMNKASRAYYNVVFERDFLRMKGNEFQRLFADLMEKRYPGGDFIRIRPWGRTGDRKNDGYLKSQRTLFQVYAPNEMKEAAALKKIEEDFTGALPHWKKYFHTWVFAHNARDGLGPGITKKLLELDHNSKHVTVTHWGYEELRLELFHLSAEAISDLLGPAPTDKEFLQIGFEDLKAVLGTISRQPAPPMPDVNQVPREKIEINRLSQDTEILINAGRRKSPLVAKFFKQYPDPEYGDEIVETFTAKYEELRIAGFEPDRIFLKLQVFAGGTQTQEPKHQAAVLAVLAYLFDQCDIFEPGREEKQ